MKTRSPKNSLSKQLMMIADNTKNVGLMDEHLDETFYVPTIFPSFNRAVVLGGAPVGCTWVVHGEYRGGKSAFCLGLVISFIENQHLAAYYDAEHAVSKKWFVQLGADPKSFLFSRPLTFEDAVDDIDTLIDNFKTAKSKGDLPPEKCLIIVVDSINKLTPKAELKKFTKEGPDAYAKGRFGQFRAGIIQAWLDRIVPFVATEKIALVCIAQERLKETDNPWEPNFRVKGGEGILYDSSVQGRVILAEKIWEDLPGRKKKTMTGQGHRIIVFKNKVGYPMEHGVFYTSNGKGSCPIGFDHARTAFMEWKNHHTGIIDQSGAWYEYRSQRYHGQDNFLKALREDPDMLFDLCMDLNQDKNIIGSTNAESE